MRLHKMMKKKLVHFKVIVYHLIESFFSIVIIETFIYLIWTDIKPQSLCQIRKFKSIGN